MVEVVHRSDVTFNLTLSERRQTSLCLRLESVRGGSMGWVSSQRSEVPEHEVVTVGTGTHYCVVVDEP